MKAEVVQQRSLLEVAELDAELSRLEHRAKHLSEKQQLEAVQAKHRDANDRLASLQIALDDLDAQVAKFESEIDAVRQREDRDRSLLASGSIDAKQLDRTAARAGNLGAPPVQPGGLAAGGDGTPGRAAGRPGRRAGEDRRAAERAAAKRQTACDDARTEIDQLRHQCRLAARRTRFGARRRSRCAVRAPAGPRRCGCRGRCRVGGAEHAGSRSTEARWRGSRRPPTTMCCAARNAVQSCCGSRVPSSEGHRRGRRRFAGKSGTGRIRVGGLVGATAARSSPRASRPSAPPPTTSPSIAG